jgi:hypothetical protein
MRTSALMVLSIACSGAPADDKDGADTDTDADTGTPDTDTDTTPGEDTSAGLQGTVASPGGPLTDVDLRLCRGSACRNAVTDASGGYLYDDVAVDWFSFEIVPPSGTSYATAFAPLEFHADETRTVDVILVPHDAASALGVTASEHAVGQGLYLTLGAADLVPPLLAPPATEVSGVLVPEGQRVPTDGISGTVLGMWYVGPFDYHAAAGDLPARFDDQWGLTDGTTLEVYVGSYDESAWVPAGTATVAAGQITGAALPLLSTVILVQP